MMSCPELRRDLDPYEDEHEDEPRSEHNKIHGPWSWPPVFAPEQYVQRAMDLELVPHSGFLGDVPRALELGDVQRAVELGEPHSGDLSDVQRAEELGDVQRAVEAPAPGDAETRRAAARQLVFEAGQMIAAELCAMARPALSPEERERRGAEREREAVERREQRERRAAERREWRVVFRRAAFRPAA